MREAGTLLTDPVDASLNVAAPRSSWDFGRAAALLVLLAVSLACIGQTLFTPLDMRSGGRLVYGVAVALLFIVAARTKLTGGLVLGLDQTSSQKSTSRRARSCLLVGGVSATAAAVLGVRGDSSLLALLAWGAGLASIVVGAGGARLPRLCLKLRLVSLFALAMITIAILARLPLLETVPPDVHIDEATMGLETRKVLRGEMPAMLALGWDQYPSLGFALHAPAMLLDGDSLTGLRITSVIGGLVTIGLTAGLARLLFGGFAAVAAGALITFSHWHIHLSRMGLHYMDAMVFSLTSIYLVTRGVLRGSPVAFAGGGIALGMCFYVYYTARLSVLVVFGIIMLGVLTRKGPLRWWAVRIGWLAAGALVTVLPLLAVYAQDPSAAVARTDRVSLFSPQNFEFVQRTYKLESTDRVLRFQAQRALEMFNLPWDTSSQFGSKDPLLDPVSGVLFVVGCAVALARPFLVSHALLLGWLVLTLAGVTLTDGIPFSPRAVIALPAVIILASLGLSTVRDALQVTFNSRSRRHLTVVFCMLLVIVAGLNTSSYFNRYISKWHPAGFATTAGRLLASEELPGPIVLVGGPEASRTIDIIRFLAPNAVYDARFEPPYDTRGESFIVDARTPEANRVIAAISSSVGDADRQPHRDPTGRLLFTVIRNRS